MEGPELFVVLGRTSSRHDEIKSFLDRWGVWRWSVLLKMFRWRVLWTAQLGKCLPMKEHVLVGSARICSEGAPVA